MIRWARRRAVLLLLVEATLGTSLLVSACAGGSPGTPSASPGGSSTGSADTSPAADPAASSSTGPAPSSSPGGTGPSSSPGGTGPSPAGPAASGSAAGSVYAQAGAGMLAPVARQAKPMVYVPNTMANTVQEIDPTTFTVVRRFKVGAVPQHVVPSWDLKTLWVNDNNGNTLVPIDPATGTPGKPVPVEDPYNLYFSPDGAHALVMAERDQRIDFRDAHTMALQHSLSVPCRGVNHADYTADLSTLLVSCEFSGKLLVVPADGSKVAKVIDLNTQHVPGRTTPSHHGGVAHQVDPGVNSMPQDVRLTADGRTFLAADMLSNGVWVIDAATLTVRSFLPTGAGAHGIYPSRDGRFMYVSNRDEGTVSVLDAVTLRQTALWRIPGGGSPDMGGVSADGRTLWLSGRSDAEVYVFDTTTGQVVHRIRTDAGPHGLAVWPQPGRFSLGHTGNMR